MQDVSEAVGNVWSLYSPACIVDTFFIRLIKSTNRNFSGLNNFQQAQKTTVQGVIEFYTKWSRF